MPKISLDLYHDGSKKVSTSKDLAPLPSLNLNYYSSSSTNEKKIGSNNNNMEFLSHVDYIVDVSVTNEPVGTKVTLKCLGCPSTALSPSTAFRDITTTSNLFSKKMITITPLNEGKIQSNRRARFRIRFDLWNNSAAGDMANYYFIFFEAFTTRGSISGVMHRVTFNPPILPLVGGREMDTNEEVLSSGSYIVLPVGTYGAWCDVFLGGGGGGGAGSRSTAVGSTELADVKNGKPGSDTNAYLIGYDQMLANEANVSPRGYVETGNIRLPSVWWNALTGYRIAGAGGGANGRVARVWKGGARTFTSEDHWGAGGVAYNGISTVESFLATTANNFWSKFVEIKVTTLVYSNGYRGKAILTDQAGGAAAYANPFGDTNRNGTGGYGGDQTGSNKPGYGGGGGSGAQFKFRVSIQRRAIAKDYPLPPLVIALNPGRLNNYDDVVPGTMTYGGAGGIGKNGWNGKNGKNGTVGVTARGWYSAFV